MSNTTPLPTPRQLEYHDWELGLFLHFGLRTFHEGWVDMDDRRMSPALFDPPSLDCDNWARTARDAGCRYVVLTAKHHDGFALWPSKTTDFSVASTPWKGGKGDVIREFVDACRRFGLAVGLYYSPYDAASPAYDDESAYDDYFVAQIGEILEPYGPIDVLWLDGCGSAGHEYDWPRIVGEIRRMQPEILLFGMGDPDIRWIGNEDGHAPLGTSNVIGHGVADHVAWIPAECDSRMRERNWFYSDADEDTIKSVDELVGMYYYSVGRGCNMLVNIGPDRRGLLPDKDAANLIAFGREIDRRFADPMASLADWARDGSSWTYAASSSFLVDHVVIAEDLTRGEHIERFEIAVDGDDCPIVVHQGLTVGHRAICSFPPVRARRIRLDVIDSVGDVTLSKLEVHSSVQ